MKVRGKSKMEMQKIFPKKLVHDDPDLISEFVNFFATPPCDCFECLQTETRIKIINCLTSVVFLVFWFKVPGLLFLHSLVFNFTNPQLLW